MDKSVLAVAALAFMTIGCVVLSVKHSSDQNRTIIDLDEAKLLYKYYAGACKRQDKEEMALIRSRLIQRSLEVPGEA